MDIYLCPHYNRHPEACPKPYIICHNVLYPYVLDQVRVFARSTKWRKADSPISEYVSILALTPEILKNVIERIKEGRVGYPSRPGKSDSDSAEAGLSDITEKRTTREGVTIELLLLDSNNGETTWR